MARAKKAHPSDGQDAGKTAIDPRGYGPGAHGEEPSSKTGASTAPAIDKRGVYKRTAPLGADSDGNPQPLDNVKTSKGTPPHKND